MAKTPKAPAQHSLLNFRADPETIAAIDALRREEEDIPTRSEMVRRALKRLAKNVASESHGKKQQK